MGWKNAIGLALTACATVLLSGCGPQAVVPTATPPSAAEETQTPTPVQTSEPSEAAAPITEISIPQECNSLVPPSTLQGYHSSLQYFDSGPVAEARLQELLGPRTMDALKSGEQTVYCGWGIPQSGAIAYLGATVIEESTKNELIESLRNSVYVEAEAKGVEARFIQTPRADHQYSDHIIIDGDLLIAVAHTIEGNFADDAFQAIRN